MPPRRIEEEALPEKLNLSVWFKIGKYAMRHWVFLLISLLCTLFVTFYDSSFVPVMNAGAIACANQIELGEQVVSDVTELVIPVTFIFGIKVDMPFVAYVTSMGVMILVRSVLIIATFYATNILSMHIMVDLRRDTFAKIQELSFSYFDRNSSGWLIARMQNDTSSIGDVLAWALNSILWCVFELVFITVTMFSINWQYSLIVLASMPIILTITPIFEKAILKANRTARNAYSHYVGYLAESIDGAKTVKSLAIEDASCEEAERITEDVRGKREFAGQLNAVFQPVITLIFTLMIALVILVGFRWLNNGRVAIDVATIILFISFVNGVNDPLTSIAEILSEFMAAQAGAEKVMQLLEAKVEIADSPEIVERYGTVFDPKKENYEKLEGDIRFEDVRFDYGNGIEVIHPLNLHIKKGTSVAIVGETGSGKTTTVNLLCRFYEPTGGKIYVDGVDYMQRSLGWLRSNIGYVQQTPFVFTGTYAENIRYGNEEATQEDIEKAAKIVGIHDFIMSSKNGYDTFLEDGGGGLSQGQKQLLSFARALVRDPAILILDEATSSIDTATEAEVQRAISGLLKGRTSIVIAHRLSTIVGSDRILFMERGRIKEDGSHKELMEKKGAYYELYMNQFRDLSIGEQVKAFEKDIEGQNVDLGKPLKDE